MSLSNQPILKMSKLTDRILRSIDYEHAKSRRIENYKLLDKELRDDNRIELSLDENSAPMVYPYFTKDGNLRDKLIQNKIFVPSYWNNVSEWCERDSTEYELAEKLMPLPIDQRYHADEMKKIIQLIKE
jgi:hypothetical protein